MKTYKLELTEDEIMVIGAAGAVMTIAMNDDGEHKMFYSIENKSDRLVFAQAMVETIPRTNSWLNLVEKMKKAIGE